MSPVKQRLMSESQYWEVFQQFLDLKDQFMVLTSSDEFDVGRLSLETLRSMNRAGEMLEKLEKELRKL